MGSTMIKNTAFIVILICFGFGESAYGQADAKKEHCDEYIVNLVGKHFEVRDFLYADLDKNGVIVAGACKVWPKDRSITIAVFVFDPTYPIYRDRIVGEKSLIVALVDNKNKKIIATYEGLVQGGVATSAEEARRLKIDTARYDIAPSVRAFGFDMGFSNNRCDSISGGGLGAVRILFVQDGKEIRPILENFHTSSWRVVKNGDLQSCSEIYYSIGISKSATNGFANLLITADRKNDKRQPFKYEIRYDGKTYPTSPFNGTGTEFNKWESAP